MPKSEEHIGFLGGGNIAFAIGSRLIASGIFLFIIRCFFSHSISMLFITQVL